MDNKLGNWANVLKDYNELKKRQDQAAGLLRPDEQALEPMLSDKQGNLPTNYNALAQDEAINPIDVVQDQSGPLAPGVVESGQTTLEQFNIDRGQADLNPPSPQDKYAQILEEYRAAQKQGEQDVADARSRDKVVKVVNALAQGLGGYANAQAQKRLGIPGVNVVTPDLSKITESSMQAPDVQADTMRKLANLKEQYTMLSKGDQDKLKEEYLKIAQENLVLGKQKAETAKELGIGNLGARGKSLELAQKKLGMPSDKQVEGITNLTDAKNELERLIPMVDEIGIGVAETPARRLKAKVLGGEDKFVEFETNFASVKNAVRNALFGSALTETEKKAFEQELNALDTNSSSFKANLNAYTKKLDRKLNEKLSGMEKQGKNVEPFKPSSSLAPTLSPKDQQALDWANSNPDDPRAATILKRLGR